MTNRTFGVLLAGLALVGCSSDEGTSTAMDGGADAANVSRDAGGAAGATGADAGTIAASEPTYPRAACGSIAASALMPSTMATSPTTFAIGQLVGGRVDPDSLTNQKHHWSIQLPRGFYHLVADAATADGKSSNLGIDVVRVGEAGGNVKVVHGNEIARRYRDEGFFEVTADATVQLQVSSVFEMEDYKLAVFPNGTPVPSPYFDGCPEPKPLTLGQPTTFALGESDTPDEDGWLLADLPIGNYKFAVQATQVSGQSTNLMYTLDLLDRFGQEERAKQVIRANEIDSSFLTQGTVSVGELTSYWVRFRNGGHPLNMSVTVTAQ